MQVCMLAHPPLSSNLTTTPLTSLSELCCIIQLHFLYAGHVFALKCDVDFQNTSDGV